jgi:hypothetical protein
MLPSGTYSYSLWIDGRQADVKQMILVKWGKEQQEAMLKSTLIGDLES